MSQEVQRRWKASIVFGLVGVLFGIIISAILDFSLLWNSGQKASQDLTSMIASGVAYFFPLCCCLNLPVFIVVTLGSYYQFKISNDVLIDAIWKKKK